jgi:hypothetical protein
MQRDVMHALQGHTVWQTGLHACLVNSANTHLHLHQPSAQQQIRGTAWWPTQWANGARHANLQTTLVSTAPQTSCSLDPLLNLNVQVEHTAMAPLTHAPDAKRVTIQKRLGLHQQRPASLVRQVQVQVQVFTQGPRNGRIKLCNCANREIQLSNLLCGRFVFRNHRHNGVHHM